MLRKKMIERQVSDIKKKEVEDIKSLIKKYPMFGVVNMEGLPSLQFQRIRHQLKDRVLIKASKKRLIKVSIDQLKTEKKDIIKTIELVRGMPALVFTDQDSFKLNKILNNNKSPAPARAGQEALNDIYIRSGATPFTPGPIISELGGLGIKSGVESGKVIIKEDKLLVKGGETISQKAADILNKLGLEPMEVGLNLMFTYHDGEILAGDILNVDERVYINNLILANSYTINLGVKAVYFSKDLINIFLQKAYSEYSALNLKIGDFGIKDIKEEKPKVGEPKEEIKKEEIKEEIKEEVRKEEPKKEEGIEEKEKVEKREDLKKEEFDENITTTKLLEDIQKEEDVKIESKDIDFERDSKLAQDILRQVTDQKIKKDDLTKKKN